MTKLPSDASAIKRVEANTSPEQVIELLKQDGVVVLKDFLDQATVQSFREEIKPAIDDFEGGPNFNPDGVKVDIGRGTKHVANLTAISKTYRHDILNNKWMHSILEPLFRPHFGDYWMNRGSVLHIEPGEPAQNLHRDDILYRVTKLRQPGDPDLMINILIAVTEFRDDNGATRFVPGSHVWDDTRGVPTPDQASSAALRPGDALLFVGSLWHGAGSNQSDAFRQGLLLCIHPCHFTPMESHLHVPRTIVESMTPQAQKMIGWRSGITQHDVPIWLAGDHKMEETMGLRSQEVQ
uniref:Dioxygenase cdmA n=1 Tax=Talaromyces verruculosus TaxID=198730 RepID=CDMA_TALVE|nr:RecName: Full=Dioxygenase cdmA; AltName: Full=Chrodrimanin B biosynthesis cluster protein A [Talaromyces verruculosus]BBG28480.1 2-oxoglutarate/Fe(II)-dependent dioxygenase CdmA [Talaromyces verruculosus]